MKIFHYISIIVLSLFAGLQWNDPDAILWIALYLLPVLVCILEISFRSFYRFRTFLLFATANLYILLFFLYMPFELLGNWDRPLHIEEFREAMGALICLSIIAIPSLYRLKKPKGRTKIPTQNLSTNFKNLPPTAEQKPM